jgi:HlyD family secretion protein
MSKLWISAGLLAALGGGGWWAWSASRPPLPAAERTVTARVERGTLTWALRASGEVQPKKQLDLKSKASGQITMFRALEGDPVEAGEILVTLDPAIEERNAERARAGVESARARRDQILHDADAAMVKTASELKSAAAEVAFRTVEFERLTTAQGAFSKSALEQARLDLTTATERRSQLQAALEHLKARRPSDAALAEAEVKQAEIALREAEIRLADTQVRSPMKGVLLKKMVEEGQIVSSGTSSVSGGTSLGIMADLSELIIVANVVEFDIGRVTLGQEARVGVEAHERRRFVGRVVLIPPKTEVEQGIARFKVRIAVPGDEARGVLRVGMTAEVELLIEERPDVLSVPSQAVIQRAGKSYLRRADGAEVPVTMGLDTGLRAEILSGAAEGDEVLVPLPADRPGGGRWR